MNPPCVQHYGITMFPEVGLYLARARLALTQARDVFGLGHYDLVIREHIDLLQVLPL